MPNRLTEEHKNKIRQSLKGRSFGYKFKKGKEQSDLIKKLWKEGKFKVSGAKGKHWKVSRTRTPEMREVQKKVMLEKWKNPEYRNEMSEKHLGKLKGNKSPLWQNGISFEPYTTDWTLTLK